MQILVVAATPMEIEILQQHLVKKLVPFGKLAFQKGENGLEFLITGVGIPATVFHLSQKLAQKKYDLVLNAGIAGAFDPNVPLGKVFQVTEDRFADLGVEEKDGTFQDVFDLELTGPNEPPFREGKLVNEQAAGYSFLPRARAITVNKVHGTEQSIRAIVEKYKPELESMEGAGVFYCCQALNIPCLQIRAVSNHVEPRNRQKWDIPLALQHLNQTLIEMTEAIF